mmetsp:Transcript_116041/g.328866  ORF Transcript_116041/g.328866 Transcript_116041/m.328866 type:complete len:240 (-) Transcript_116041:435-1154(-)
MRSPTRYRWVESSPAISTTRSSASKGSSRPPEPCRTQVKCIICSSPVSRLTSSIFRNCFVQPASAKKSKRIRPSMRQPKALSREGFWPSTLHPELILKTMSHRPVSTVCMPLASAALSQISICCFEISSCCRRTMWRSFCRDCHCFLEALSLRHAPQYESPASTTTHAARVLVWCGKAEPKLMELIAWRSSTDMWTNHMRETRMGMKRLTVVMQRSTPSSTDPSEERTSSSQSSAGSWP